MSELLLARQAFTPSWFCDYQTPWGFGLRIDRRGPILVCDQCWEEVHNEYRVEPPALLCDECRRASPVAAPVLCRPHWNEFVPALVEEWLAPFLAPLELVLVADQFHALVQAERVALFGQAHVDNYVARPRY